MFINQLISAATSDCGISIDAAHRSLMEDCFQTSFRDLRLHFSLASQVANDALGSLAFTVDDHICFRPGFDACPGAPYTYLLAHELTHVMQKRRGRKPGRTTQSIGLEEQLENEADAIAFGVLKGMRAARVTPDPSSAPRLYGPAGHYYTAFYTAAAVGFDFATASAIAFYTQLPDLVEEIDAYKEGLVWNKQFGMANASSAESCLSIFKSDQAYWEHSADHAIDRMVLAWQVQAGLHALTGGDAHAESDLRESILGKQKPGTLKLGLALHAFGDSFAHRDFDKGDKMYGPPFGHGTEFVNHLLRDDSSLNAHDPDIIGLRKDLYLEYGSRLYKVLSGMSPNKAPVGLDPYKDALLDVACKEFEVDQEGFLASEMAKIYRLGDDIYRPPDDSVPWNEFQAQPKPKQMHLDPAVVTNALGCAAEWCGGALPFRISVHGDWQALRHNVTQSVVSIPSDIQNTLLTVTGANLSPTEFLNQLYGGTPYR